MVRRLSQALVAACLVCHAGAAELVAQDLGDAERAQLDDWYRRTADRTVGGQWGVAIGTMDGRVLWSMSPELALIPASTAKVFTTGFSRHAMGGDGRITTRVVGDGVLEPASGRWLGTWALELGGDRTLERTGRERPDASRARQAAPGSWDRHAVGPARPHQPHRSGQPPLSLHLVLRLRGTALRAAGRPGRAAREHRSRSPTGPAGTRARRRRW